MSNHDWMAGVKCRGEDPELFFDPQSVQDALDVCNSCPVRSDCLEYALKEDLKYGVWGGMTERERDIISRKQRAAAWSGSIATQAAS